MAHKQMNYMAILQHVHLLALNNIVLQKPVPHHLLAAGQAILRFLNKLLFYSTEHENTNIPNFDYIGFSASHCTKEF